MDLLKNILLMARQHREFRAAYAELNGYSERELAELGIGRGDIARVAYEEAERRMAASGARDRVTVSVRRAATLASAQ